ncbi:MAG: serine/threonine-protein kinase [Planctomycetota bacterium]
MEAPSLHPDSLSRDPGPRIDWESFYANYRKPGYISGFEIVNKLGGGVFGLVFKARKESIGKDYAIKFLKVDDEVVRDAVVRELGTVRYFAQIDHPNLVSIEDKGEVDGIPFIVMSYAGDGTLRDRLNEGRLSREDALRVFLQAARGVQALHERSLVHFDLKPANIFLKGDIARVGDYGLSKLITESRNSLSFGRGTPYYMAPEMLQRRGDARSDVYSLGVILYECLVGDVPFRGDSEWEVLRKHESQPVEFPDHVAAAERRAIERCLAKDPEQRFQTAEELLHALQAPASLGESLVIPPAAYSRRPDPAAQTSAEPLRAASIGAAVPPPPSPQPPPSAPEFSDPAAEPRDPAGSPYGMPWREERQTPLGGLVGGTVGVIFKVLELGILAVLLPVRAISLGLGRGLIGLLQLPFRILALAFQLIGYVVMAALVVMVVVGMVYLGSLFV